MFKTCHYTIQKRFILNTAENVSKNLSFHSSFYITHPFKWHTLKFSFNFRLKSNRNICFDYEFSCLDNKKFLPKIFTYFEK